MGNRRILVIDDDPEIWQVYQDVLAPDLSAKNANQQLSQLLTDGRGTESSPKTNLNFELRFASQGQEGVDIAEAYLETGTPFAVAFIDVRMPPGLDGLETAVRIRQHDPNIEIVIVTAYSDRPRDEIVEAVAAPDKLLFLRKPFDPEELTQLALSLTTKWTLSRENKKREEELRNSEERFRALVETSRDWVWEVDKEGRFTYCSSACENIYGYTSDELTGRFLFDILTSPADRMDLEQLLRQCIEQKTGFRGVERKGLRKNGGIVYIESSVVPVLDRQEAVIGFRGIERDISERKEAEAKLRKAHFVLEERVKERTADLIKLNENLRREIEDRKAAEEKLRSAHDEFYQIFDTASDGIRVIDKEFNTIRVNEAFASLVKMKKKNILEQKCYDVVKEPECHTRDCPLTRILHGEPHVEYETEKQLPDGSVLPCITTAYPFRSVSGEVIGIVAANKDISNWKETQKTLQTFAADLERSNQDLQNFAYTVSHDLQEPLGLVRAFGERLRKKFGERIPEQGRGYIERIEKSTKRMQELISGLLTLSRMSAETTSLEQVDLAETVQDVLSDLEMRIRSSGGTVEVGNLCTIEADPVQTHQLLQNLIGNALKYQAPGTEPRVKVFCKMVPAKDGANPVCKIIVRDNGIGFDEGALEHIFGIFKRLHGRQEYEGSGVGLAICKRIVENHGGRITATSSPGAGAEFIVSLPQRKKKEGVASKESLFFLF